MSFFANCGLFGIEEDHIESSLSLDERFVPHPETSFIFQMQGDSMGPYIRNGDYVLVDRGLEVMPGALVIVDVMDDRICKQYIEDPKLGRLLRSFNPKYKDILLTEETEVRFFGRVRLLLREVRC